MYGTRWLVVDGDSLLAGAVARELHEAGCTVRLIDPEGRQVPQLGAYDAQIVVTDVAHDMRFLGERLLAHPGMRWASTLRVNWSELRVHGMPAPALGMLAARAVMLLEPDNALRELGRSGLPRFNAPFEMLGPVRMLRALCTHDEVFRITLNTVDEHARVELAGNLVLGASYVGRDGNLLVGEAAMSRLVELTGARAEVERRPRAESLTVVAPLDEQLEKAIGSVLARRESDDAPTLRMSAASPPPPSSDTDDTAPGSLHALVEAARLDAQLAGLTDEDAPTKSEFLSRQATFGSFPLPRAEEPIAREPLASLPSRPGSGPIILPRVHAPVELPRWMSDFPARLRARLRRLEGERRLPGIPGPREKLQAALEQLGERIQVQLARGGELARAQLAKLRDLPGVSGELPRWVPLSAVGIVTSALLVLWTTRIVLLWTGERHDPRVAQAPLPPRLPSPPPGAAPAGVPARERPVARAPSRAGANGALPGEWRSARDRSDQLLEQARQAATPEAARQSLEAALEADAKNPHVLEKLARDALAAGDVAKALECVERAVALRPRRATYRVLYGDVLAADGQREAALKQYRLALARRPRSAEVRARIQRMLAKPTT